MNSVTLVTHLRTLGLWPEEEPQQRTVVELSERLPDSRELARELIQRDLLTPYQANLLLTGKGQQLVVGPYRILHRLGEGGMGQVFKARRQLLHRIVALKIIRPERLTNATALQRFLREVEAIAKVSHPNIVRAYDADQADGLFYFAMQFVPGTDLSKLVKQNGRLPIAQACEYVYQAAQGLQHIHESNLIHRDIKPSNLMVSGGAEGAATPQAATIKILDLGLARLTEEEAATDGKQLGLTQLGAVMGTADFMAPEQARDSRLADARSDIYSLGCTLYFALCGRPPFPGGTPIEKILHHQLDEPEAVEQLRPEISPALAQVVRRMMAKEPEQRYQQAAQVAADLLPLYLDQPAVAVPVHAEEPAVAVPVHATPVTAQRNLEFDFRHTDAPTPSRRSVAGRPLLLEPKTWGNWLWVAVAGGVALTLLVVGLVVRALSR